MARRDFDQLLDDIQVWSHAGNLDIAALLDSIQSPLAVVDPDMRFVSVNEAYCLAGGRSRQELLGVGLFEAFPENPEDETGTGPNQLREALERVFETGIPEVMPLQRYDVQEEPGAQFEERFWSITTSPVRSFQSGLTEYAVVHAEEVTDFIDERLSREAAGQLPRTAGLTDAVDTVFSAALQQSQTLNDLAENFLSSLTTAEVARAFARHGIAMVGASGGAFISRQGSQLSVLDQRGIARLQAHTTQFMLMAEKEPISDAILSGEPKFFDTRAEFFAAYPRLDTQPMADRHQSLAILPLVDGADLIGALALAFDEANPFTPEKLLALRTLTNLTTQAASRALLLEEQADAIASVTAVLEEGLDRPVTVKATTLYRPASIVGSSGGDWFDVIALSDSLTLLAVGDVANHGPGVTGDMLRARATLQSFALHLTSCDEIAESVSASLRRFGTSFASACIALYDANRGTLTWTTAGHPYPLLITESGVELLAETHGPPLGVDHNASGRYGHGCRTVRPGDTLVLYTDGLIERRAGESLDHGFARLRAAASARSDAVLVEHLYSSLLPTGVHDDDVAILTATFESAGTSHDRPRYMR